MDPTFEIKPYAEARIRIVLGLWSSLSHAFYWQSIFSLKPPKQLSFNCRCGYADHNLNALTKEHNHWDAVFLTEWDHEYPPDVLKKLWNTNKAVTAGLYVSRTQPTHVAMAGKELPGGGIEYESEIPNVPFKTDWTGLGCMLIRKEVFDLLKPPFFDPVVKGIDRDFCLKLKKHKIDLWINPHARVGHMSSDMLWPRGTSEELKRGIEFQK